MGEEGTETPTVETPEVAAPETETAETEESTGQDKEESPASDETPAEGDSGEPKSESDSEERATETAKRLSMENRQIKRQLRQLREQVSKRPEVQEAKPPTKPKLEEFYSEDDPQAALDKALEKFEKDTQAYAIAKDRREQAKKAKQEAAETQKKADLEVWNKREKETLKRNPDYNLQESYQDVDPSPAMDGFMMDSDIGPDILWHLKQNLDEADRIRQLPPYQAVRAMIKLEETLSNQIKGIKPKPPATKPTATVKGSGSGPAKPKSLADRLYGT